MTMPLTTRRRALSVVGAVMTGDALSGCATPVDIVPSVKVGRVERFPPFASAYVSPRNVDVWLPPGYRPDGSHAVLYMHDGQMLFDATNTWNHQSWNVAETAAALIGQKRSRPFIVVGIWNSGPTRFTDYFPQAFFERIPEGEVRAKLLARTPTGGFASNQYLRYLVEELKPAVDAHYRPALTREQTFLAGSSMGGLISIYALTRYPETFGGIACLSTHWIGIFERNDEIPTAAIESLRQTLPSPGRHRIYMDRGTVGLDALYDMAQPRVDALMLERGFVPPLFDTRVFPGASHTEADWAARLDVPLTHLLSAT